MSLTKVLSALFQKHVIAFLIVKRHDLGLTEDLIRYISIKPSISIQKLRQKVWHLLDLPDYCDEIIVLRTSDNVEIPLKALRKGNEPNRPFILEVWSPVKSLESTMTEATLAVHKRNTQENSRISFIPADFNKCELNSRVSATSLLSKLQGRKSSNNLANVLLKIQNDLSTLSYKLSSLETKIPA